MYTSNRRPQNNSQNGRIVRDNERELINYIYDNSDISKYNYEILKNKSQLPKIFENSYSLMPNFFGYPSLLVFIKKKDKYYQFVVERKTLSYSRELLDFNKIKLKYVTADVDSSVYSGTILDGTYIESPRGNTFMISDVYSFKGDDMTNVDLFVKLLKIRTYLSSPSAVPDISILEDRHKMYPKINLEVCEEVPIENIETYIKDGIFNTKFKVRGLCFYPNKSGTKLIYLFTNTSTSTDINNKSGNITKRNTRNSPNNNTNTNSRKDNLSSHHSEKKISHKKSKLVASSSKSIYAILEMKSVSESASDDLYYLSAVEKVKKDGKNKYVRVKMGLADIPTKECSEWCRDLMMESDNGTVLVKCKFNKTKGKWEPVKHETKAARPDRKKDIKVDIIEETDSDEN
jgi:hypothetical protein